MVQTVPLQFGIPGGPELLIILLLAVLLFGADRLPRLARSSGEAIGEFRKGRQEVESEIKEMRGEGVGRDGATGDGESGESSGAGESGESSGAGESGGSSGAGESGEQDDRDERAHDEIAGSTGKGESQDSSLEEGRDEEVIRESDFQWGG